MCLSCAVIQSILDYNFLFVRCFALNMVGCSMCLCVCCKAGRGRNWHRYFYLIYRLLFHWSKPIRLISLFAQRRRSIKIDSISVERINSSKGKWCVHTVKWDFIFFFSFFLHSSLLPHQYCERLNIFFSALHSSFGEERKKNRNP